MHRPVDPDSPRHNDEQTLIRRALRLGAWPVVIALFITPIRFFLELAGVPTRLRVPARTALVVVGALNLLGLQIVRRTPSVPAPLVESRVLLTPFQVSGVPALVDYHHLGAWHPLQHL